MTAVTGSEVGDSSERRLGGNVWDDADRVAHQVTLPLMSRKLR